MSADRTGMKPYRFGVLTYPFKVFLSKNIRVFNALLRLRTKFRLCFWKIERVFFGIARRREKYCIFRKKGSGGGLFAVFNQFLAGIAYADRKALIPSVDMKSSINTYLNENEVGRVNSWEYYFEQPSGISPDDALKHKNTVIYEVGSYPVPRQDLALFFNQDGQLDYWRGIRRKYIRFTPAVIERFEAMKKKYHGKKILGILVRGTDYITLKLHSHPIPPTAEQAIAKAQEVMRQKDFDALYLATEDKGILAKFQAVFGDNLLLPEAGEYFDYDYSSKKLLYEYMKDDKYTQGLNYLVSMLFLSQCDGFITSMTSGSVGVMLLSEGFDYLYVFDLGYYD